MYTAQLISTGAFLPSKIVKNEDLTQFPPRILSLIEEKTGVKERRILSENEATSDLGLKAALECLSRADFSPEKIQAIILSTSSPDQMQPATAARVQSLLGAKNSFAFDINSVCSGGVVGIDLAHSMISCGKYENVLVIAAEAYSRILNPQDFSTFPYFGDGAGALLFQKGESSNGKGVLGSQIHTNGDGFDSICVPGGGSRETLTSPLPFRELCFRMNGKEVYSFATKSAPLVISEVLKKFNISKSEISQFVCHQANINIIERISEELNLPTEKFFTNLDRYGNTASASVIIALHEALNEKKICPGDFVIVNAFGGGLSWGANLLQIPFNYSLYG